MRDLQISVAKPFKIAGDKTLDKKKFKQILSLKLEWFDPAGSEEVLERGLKNGLLEEKEEGKIEPVFNINHVDIPLEFKPALEINGEGLFEKIIFEVGKKLDKKRNEVVAGANRIQSETGNFLTIEASTLIYGLKNGLRLPELAEKAAENLERKN